MKAKTETSEIDVNTHFVYITDENAISILFTEIKSKLLENPTGFKSLIYFTNKNKKRPLFKFELASLEKRFSHQLEINYISNNVNISLSKTILQETLEVVINSSLVNDIYFQITGNEFLVEQVMAIIQFLGISQNKIKTQIL